MILLTQCYYHRGPLFFATYGPTGMLRRSRCVRIFSLKTYRYQYSGSVSQQYEMQQQ